MKGKHVVLVLLVGVLAVLIGWTVWGNTALMVSHYTIEGETLPDAFDGFKLAQVSDLHNAEFGADNETLLALLRAQAPDAILITGDLIDSYHPDVEIAARFAAACVDIAPTYYVTGNHEARLVDREFPRLEERLEQTGVTVLRDETVALTRDGAEIGLIGVDDPSFGYEGFASHVVSTAVEEFGFTVLLAHRPELFDRYVACGVDVTFSGHAHGGQFRLPWVGGLAAPGQGLFPEYDAGVFSEGNCRMVVSRGLGNSLFPIRFNNRPELVVVTLKCAA